MDPQAEKIPPDCPLIQIFRMFSPQSAYGNYLKITVETFGRYQEKGVLPEVNHDLSAEEGNFITQAVDQISRGLNLNEMLARLVEHFWGAQLMLDPTRAYAPLKPGKPETGH